MKRFLVLVFSLVVAFILTGCTSKTTETQVTTTINNTTTTKEVTTTTDSAWDYKVQEYELLDYNTEYTLTHDKLKGYYFNSNLHAGNDSLLFVDFDEFLEALDGFLVYEEYKFVREDDKYTVYITYEDEDTHETQDCYLIIDLVNDTITLDLFFIYNTNDMEETDYGYGLNIVEEKCYENEDIRATYTFSQYKIDFFKYEDKYFVPYWVANLFLCTFDYCNVFFNEEEFIFVYTDLSDLTDEQKDRVYDCEMANSSASKDKRYNVYYQLSFIFEQIFGVREDEKFTKLNDKLSQTTKVSLTSQSPTSNVNGYKALCYKDINDLHTYAVHPSFYMGKNAKFSLSIDDVGNFFLDNNNLYWDLSDARDELVLVGDDKYVRFYEDTAIITFDSFDTAATKDIFDEDGNLLDTAKDEDSFYYIKYCLEKIAEHGGIKNIVMDTTLNGGGNVGAMLRVLGYFIKDIYTDHYYKGFGYKTSTCYNVDTNLDDVVDENDLYDQYTWYCLSSGYSYSAANTFALICKNSGVKVIGQHTGGGMCSILPLCLIDGTSIYTSGYSCTTFYSGKADGVYEFVDVQNGIDVDIQIAKADLYNDEAIYNAIHNTGE